MRPLGVRTVNLSIAWKARKERKSDAEIETGIGFVTRIAREIAGEGLDVVLHNPDVEMLEEGGEWNALMTGTDPAQVGACLDIDWIIRAGGKPEDVIRDAGPRLKVVHCGIRGAGCGPRSWPRATTITERSRGSSAG